MLNHDAEPTMNLLQNIDRIVVTQHLKNGQYVCYFRERLIMVLRSFQETLQLRF